MTKPATTTDWVNGEIRSRLARSRRSQQQLAEHLGLSGGSITRRLAGSTDWSLPELEQVAAFLETSLLDLVTVRDVA